MEIQTKQKQEINLNRYTQNGLEYIESMMLWAKDNISKEEMIDIIKGEEGKAVGAAQLQKEIDELESRLRNKKKELLKKTMALYFLNKPEKRENMEYAKYEV